MLTADWTKIVWNLGVPLRVRARDVMESWFKLSWSWASQRAQSRADNTIEGRGWLHWLPGSQHNTAHHPHMAHQCHGHASHLNISPPLLTLHNWITKHIPQGSEKMSLICIQTSRHKSARIHHHFHLYSACCLRCGYGRNTKTFTKRFFIKLMLPSSLILQGMSEHFLIFFLIPR